VKLVARSATRLHGRSPLVTVVELVLLLNALPAFVVLTVFAGRTEDLFVWTVKPEASARLLAAMYGNAAALALLSLARRAWPDKRVAFVVFTLFSVAATAMTFVHVDPFLSHPRYIFAYWLANYFFLCIVTPSAFVLEERVHGGRLAVDKPLTAMSRTAGAAAALACLLVGAGMFAGPDFMASFWPWPLTPLVARIVGVWLTSLGAAFVWALWDGDAGRSRPIFAQGLPTAVLVGVAPLTDRSATHGGVGHLAPFCALVGALALAGLVALPWGARRQP
jgi:hypothetical protein